MQHDEFFCAATAFNGTLSSFGSKPGKSAPGFSASNARARWSGWLAVGGLPVVVGTTGHPARLQRRVRQDEGQHRRAARGMCRCARRARTWCYVCSMSESGESSPNLQECRKRRHAQAFAEGNSWLASSTGVSRPIRAAFVLKPGTGSAACPRTGLHGRGRATCPIRAGRRGRFAQGGCGGTVGRRRAER